MGAAAGISPAVTSMSQVNTNPAVATKTSFGAPIMSSGHTILWTREAVMIQDYQLLKSFAQKLLAFQRTYQGLERTLSLETLEEDNSPQLYTSNGIGGFAYIPMNKLGAIYRSTVNMNILKALAALSYQYLPGTGSRGMQFNYGLKGFPTTSVNKTITY